MITEHVTWLANQTVPAKRGKTSCPSVSQVLGIKTLPNSATNVFASGSDQTLIVCVVVSMPSYPLNPMTILRG